MGRRLEETLAIAAPAAAPECPLAMAEEELQPLAAIGDTNTAAELALDGPKPILLVEYAPLHKTSSADFEHRRQESLATMNSLDVALELLPAE
jgi:hypothetical protein